MTARPSRRTPSRRSRTLILTGEKARPARARLFPRIFRFLSLVPTILPCLLALGPCREMTAEDAGGSARDDPPQRRRPCPRDSALLAAAARATWRWGRRKIAAGMFPDAARSGASPGARRRHAAGCSPMPRPVPAAQLHLPPCIRLSRIAPVFHSPGLPSRPVPIPGHADKKSARPCTRDGRFFCGSQRGRSGLPPVSGTCPRQACSP